MCYNIYNKNYGVNKMDKKDIHYNVQDLGHFYDKSGDIHFAIKCDNCVYDIKNKEYRNLADEIPEEMKVQSLDCFDISPRNYILYDGYHLLLNGLPDLKVYPEYFNFRMVYLQSRLEEYAGRSEYSLRDLEKINSMYSKFFEIKNKIFQKISHKVYLSAKKALKEDEKASHSENKKDSQEKDL